MKETNVFHVNPEIPSASALDPVGEFWFNDDLTKWPPSTGSTGQSFRIRKFSNEPTTSFFRRNKGLGRELFFFASLVTVGSIIVSHHRSLIDERDFFASMFFASGFIPALQLFFFDILPRQIQKLNSNDGRSGQEIYPIMELDHVLSLTIAAIFLAIGISISPTPPERADGWDIVSGKTLFEAGLIYFVTRVLFFVPNPNDEIRELNNEIYELKQSMATGLADGYFWNLVKEIAMDVRDANGPQKTLKLTYPGQAEVYKSVKRFLVIVPRRLNWEKEDPIADFIKGCKAKGYFKDCKIAKSPLRGASSRIKWVTHVVADRPRSSSHDDDLNEAILLDIPTTITALLMNLKAQSAHDGKIDVAKFEKEVSSFSYRIAWQLKKQNLEKYVSVVEVEDLGMGAEQEQEYGEEQEQGPDHNQEFLKIIYEVDEFRGKVIYDLCD